MLIFERLKLLENSQFQPKHAKDMKRIEMNKLRKNNIHGEMRQYETFLIGIYTYWYLQTYPLFPCTGERLTFPNLVFDSNLMLVLFHFYIFCV